MMREHITNSNESMIFHYPIPFSLVTWLKFVGKKKKLVALIYPLATGKLNEINN